MKKMSISMVGLIAIALIPFAGTTKIAQAASYYSLATSHTGGIWYIIGAGFASHINKRNPNMVITAEITAGVLENYNLIKRKKLDYAFSNPDLVYDDIKEKLYGGISKSEVNQVLWSYQFSQLDWYVKKDSSIKTVFDFKGKNVCAGPPATTTMINNLRVIKILTGYEPDKDFKAFYYSPGEAKSAFQDGLIDVGLQPGGYPAPIIMDLSRIRDIRLISLTKEQVSDVRKKYPGLKEIITPAMTYKGIDQPITTIGWGSGIICRPSIPEEDVYRFITTLFVDVNERNSFHPQTKYYNIEATIDFGASLASVGIPFHPGVIKYLKEIGKWNPGLEVK